MRKGEIYFIECMPMEAVKIGFTRAGAHNRLDALQTGCPAPLRLAGSITGTMEDERRLHAVFAPLHIHGEWFRYELTLLDMCIALFGGNAPKVGHEEFEHVFHDLIMQMGAWSPISGDDYDEYCSSADWEPFRAQMWDRFGPWEESWA